MAIISKRAACTGHATGLYAKCDLASHRSLFKLSAEFTKSGPRHSNDNGLAETKSGAVILKHLDSAHIPYTMSPR